MIKKISVFIAIIGLVFVGIPRPTVQASTETGNTHFLKVEWDEWGLFDNYDVTEATGEILRFTDLNAYEFEYNIAYALQNKTTEWGSKDVYISLSGAHRVIFSNRLTSSADGERHFGYFLADGLIIRSNRLWLMLGGEIAFDLSLSFILENLNNSADFVLVRIAQDITLDDLIFAEGRGYDTGFDNAKAEYGHYYQGSYRTAEWYGNYRYNKGVSENVEAGGFGMLLSSAFTAVGSLLSIELLPNISIGALVAIPVVFGVVMFIIGRRKE